jgi:hypothetical protein
MAIYALGTLVAFLSGGPHAGLAALAIFGVSYYFLWRERTYRERRSRDYQPPIKDIDITIPDCPGAET